MLSARAEAQFRVADPAPGENFVVELGLMFWEPTPGLQIQTGALAALGESEVDFVQEFGIENARFKEFRGVIKAAKKHKIRVSHVLAEYDASTVLQRTISFGGQTVPGQRSGDSGPEVEGLALRLRMGLRGDGSRCRRLRHRVEGQYVSADLEATGVGSELTEVSAPVPTIGGISRVYPHKHFSLTAELTGFKVPGFMAKKFTDAIDNDADAKVFDLDLYGTVNFGSHVGAQVGLSVAHRGLSLRRRCRGSGVEGVVFRRAWSGSRSTT